MLPVQGVELLQQAVAHEDGDPPVFADEGLIEALAQFGFADAVNEAVEITVASVSRDFSSLDIDDLRKIRNEDLKAWLRDHNIAIPKAANKEVLASKVHAAQKAL